MPVKMINESEEPKEVKKREKVSFCIVNAHPIKSFITDKENFLKEVRKALGLKV
ncbi:MAG: hypothetical protein ACE5WD_11490 [Candidatus Aminicenantia bacterium]